MPTVTLPDLAAGYRGLLNVSQLGWSPGVIGPAQLDAMQNASKQSEVNGFHFTEPGIYTLSRGNTWAEYPFWASGQNYNAGDIVQHSIADFNTAGADFFTADGNHLSAGDDSDLGGGSDTGGSWTVVSMNTPSQMRLQPPGDLTIKCEPGVVIECEPRSYGNMVSIRPGSTSGSRLRLEGGVWDASNQLNPKVTSKEIYPPWGGASGPRGQDGNSPVITGDCISARQSSGGDGITDAYWSKIELVGVELYAGVHHDLAGSDSGFFTDCAVDVTVRDCRFQGFRDSAVYLSAGGVTSNAMIDHVGFADPQAPAIRYHFLGNHFINGGRGAAAKNGYGECIFEGNRVYNCTWGLDSNNQNQTRLWGSKHITFIGNTLTRCNNAINVYEAERFTIVDNVITDSGWVTYKNLHPADPLNDNGGTASNTYGWTRGIHLKNGNGVVEGNTIRNLNRVWITHLGTPDNQYGIYMDENVLGPDEAPYDMSNPTIVKRNTISGLGYAVRETGPATHHYYDNQFVNCENHPIWSVDGGVAGVSIDYGALGRSAELDQFAGLNHASGTWGNNPANMTRWTMFTSGGYSGGWAFTRGVWFTTVGVTDLGNNAIAENAGWGDFPGELWAVEITWATDQAAGIGQTYGWRFELTDTSQARTGAASQSLAEGTDVAIDDRVTQVARFPLDIPRPVDAATNIAVSWGSYNVGLGTDATNNCGVVNVELLWRPAAGWTDVPDGWP